MPYGSTLRGILGAGGGALYENTSYSGTGATQSIITGQNLINGGLVWLKRIDGSDSHYVFDASRGATKYVNTNNSNAAGTDANTLTSFNSNGFTIGSSSLINGSADYMAFSWTEAFSFFAEITYTGNATARNIAHGLGATPKLILVKNTTGTEAWQVYHVTPGETKSAEINSTSAFAIDAAWDDTAPDSTNFRVGTASDVNGTGNTYIAYLFAEKSGASKIASYAGTGSSNAVTGLGFSPKAVLTKAIDNTEQWAFNYLRGGTVYHVVPNASNAESSALMSFDSDGFTLTGTAQNASSQDYLYAAWG
jgi:hypothetical protein